MSKRKILKPAKVGQITPEAAAAAVKAVSETVSEVTMEVSVRFLANLNNLLTDARENNHQLLTEHDGALGRTTRQNRMLAEMYEREGDDLDKAIYKIRQMIK